MNKGKSVWLSGVCIGLVVAVTACGTGGRNLNAYETQNEQYALEIKDTENVQNSKETQEVTGTKNVDALREEIFVGLTDDQKNWMGGLSKKQRMDDFESLCDGLRDNYPYVRLAKREVGANLDAMEADYRWKVEQCANDDAFYEVLKEFIGEFSYTGHLDLWGRRYESELASLREHAKEPGQEEKDAPYIKALDNPVSKNTYDSMTDYYLKVESLVEEKLIEENGGERGEAAEVTAVSEVDAAWAEETISANVETKILETGKIAYVSIKEFDWEQMEEDRGVLLPFYEKIRDYDNLIIDITKNPGGSMLYFNELVTAPLCKETLTVPGYQLFKDGENNRTFLRIEEGIASGLYRPISELPAMPKLNREDAADCGWFLREDYTVEPTGDGFDGKIWLLVSEKNYSSSEYAAMFSKASGFATLVGRTTSGDGIGTDPVYLILPNSGLVVQYSPMYGVTADGTGSEEYGTEPDIVSPKGESALETCLKKIV